MSLSFKYLDAKLLYRKEAMMMFQPLTGLVARENERELARRFAMAGRVRLAREAAGIGTCRGAERAGAAPREPVPAVASTQRSSDRSVEPDSRDRPAARATAA